MPDKVGLIGPGPWALQVYQMARAQGLTKEDGSAIIKVIEELAGVKIGQGD